jgi:hypothetical protein
MSAPPAEVVDRLDRLAAHAPVGAVDPDVVWARGRRRQRWRAGAALAAVVVVGLLGTTTTSSLLAGTQRVEPAVSEDRLVLPDVIRQPGAWEPAFPAPPGRLSAVGVGTRGDLWTWSGRNSAWGVSASTGESRFLDLPDALPGAQPALSADGTRVAYWLDTSADVDALGAAGESAMLSDGVAVLDVESGARRTWTLESPHGLWVGGLAWAGDVVWWSAGAARESAGALTATGMVHTWDLRSGRRTTAGRTALGQPVSANGVVPGTGGFIESVAALRATRVTGVEPPTELRLELPDDSTPGETRGVRNLAPSSDGTRVAGLLAPSYYTEDAAPLDLVVGGMDGRSAELSVVDGVEAGAVLGWRSPTEVVLADLDDVEPGRPARSLRAWTVDVTTGERSDLLELSGNTPQVAAGAWAAEVVPAPDAPVAPDPRLVGAGGMVALAFSVSLWRDLRRRRGHS